jgi:hypothetical protein
MTIWDVENRQASEQWGVEIAGIGCTLTTYRLQIESRATAGALHGLS